jgi:CubicO group peptidase (beta-lactamase class C family)
MEEGGVPGFAIGVVDGPRVLFTDGYGRADRVGRAVTVDTPFILGSTSKSFTALCVMQLVDAGRIELDQPIDRYLPGFLRGDPAAQGMTVRMLLNQTSGVSHAAGDQPILFPGELGDDAIHNRAMSLTRRALNRRVGASYEYSNANYAVPGAIVRRPPVKHTSTTYERIC